MIDAFEKASFGQVYKKDAGYEYSASEPQMGEPSEIYSREDSSAETSWIEGKSFVTTGLSGKDEALVAEVVEEHGGSVKSGISKKTNYLIYNPDYDHETSKMKKAKELVAGGLEIGLITTEDFFAKTGTAVDSDVNDEDDEDD